MLPTASFNSTRAGVRDLRMRKVMDSGGVWHHKRSAWLDDGARRTFCIPIPCPLRACHSLHQIWRFLKSLGIWDVIRVVCAPRLTWHSRNRLLTHPCHLTLPTRLLKGSLYPHNPSLWSGFRAGRRDHLGHSPSCLLPALRWSTWPLCTPNIWGWKPVAG